MSASLGHADMTDDDEYGGCRTPLEDPVAHREGNTYAEWDAFAQHAENEQWRYAHGAQVRHFSFDQHNVGQRHADMGSSACARFCADLAARWISNSKAELTEAGLEALLSAAVSQHDCSGHVGGCVPAEAVSRACPADARTRLYCAMTRAELLGQLLEETLPYAALLTVPPLLLEAGTLMNSGTQETGLSFCFLVDVDMVHVIDSHRHTDVFEDRFGLVWASFLERRPGSSGVCIENAAEWLDRELFPSLGCVWPSQIDIVFLASGAAIAGGSFDLTTPQRGSSSTA